MPLLLLAFGFGDASKIALVATAVFFPVIINTYAGAANIDRIYWDVARNYGASPYILFTRVVFFGALPLIFAGLRIALAGPSACGGGRVRGLRRPVSAISSGTRGSCSRSTTCSSASW